MLFGVEIVCYLFASLICIGVKKYKNSIKWSEKLNELITIFLETYIEFLVAGYFYIMYSSFESNRDKLNSIFAVLCFGFDILVIPMMFLYVWSRPMSEYDKETFRNKWSAFIKDLKH